MGPGFPDVRQRPGTSRRLHAEKKTYSGATKARDEFRPAPFAREALRHLVRVAKDRGVPVALWLNPSPADSVTRNYTAGVDRLIQELRRDEPDLIVLQTVMPTLGGDRFGTITHLNPAAAVTHSGSSAWPSDRPSTIAIVLPPADDPDH